MASDTLPMETLQKMRKAVERAAVPLSLWQLVARLPRRAYVTDLRFIENREPGEEAWLRVTYVLPSGRRNIIRCRYLSSEMHGLEWMVEQRAQAMADPDWHWRSEMSQLRADFDRKLRENRETIAKVQRYGITSFATDGGSFVSVLTPSMAHELMRLSPRALWQMLWREHRIRRKREATSTGAPATLRDVAVAAYTASSGPSFLFRGVFSQVDGLMLHELPKLHPLILDRHKPDWHKHQGDQRRQLRQQAHLGRVQVARYRK